uniref:Uncharacterized protein n=2 Tax=Dulem virus 29 TaxID=3145747 RepID=A0AAU8B1L2_9CAUD
MTIDEFMRDIAPKMRPGWVAMDFDGDWYWYLDKPTMEDDFYSAINFCIESEDIDWETTNIISLESIEEIATKALKEIEGCGKSTD